MEQVVKIVQSAEAEIEAKKAKLAELKRARLERQASLADSRSGGSVSMSQTNLHFWSHAESCSLNWLQYCSHRLPDLVQNENGDRLRALSWTSLFPAYSRLEQYHHEMEESMDLVCLDWTRASADAQAD